ncbi:hypothetical protein FRC11_003275 [Ceratobasidium sp. 423]|nr:hypothetical protein FRC11_003275 [Ceratobasidium sp. 423]
MPKLTFPADKYIKNGNAPEIRSYIFLSGPFWMLPRTDDSVEAENFEVVTDGSLPLHLLSPTVMAIGTVGTVIERDLYMDVRAYSRDAKKMVTYQIIITVPDNHRWANMKLPQLGANVGVCGVLSDISMHEEITSIELDSITFLPCTDFSCKDEGSTQGSIGARTKCQLMSEKAEVAVVKKTKSGPTSN